MFNENEGIKSSDDCIKTIDLMGNGDLVLSTFMGYYGAGQSMLMCVGCADPRLYKIFSRMQD